ncbi:DUF4142 domain-containing protein [Pseudonocardia asaccharolytica]|uniref:DUF4142 domain-containing protein n=1 Tax=Pseudonocardia asaccharolytica DSM 44247 = NBRC 16224 TaxID=1123024 RepID=A0A511D7B3_9PSEU|nr:DUF4142 domain-containing protein [Pseudonocardia asaccharolytica]GEL19514.1 hypothetical protein PA7_33510 [Pseudonocardia asaccharolytica DSM 44247 = NBRC 16224]
MLRRIPAYLRWSIVIALVAAVSISVVQSWVAAAPGTGGWTQTQFGPLGPADRDLLVKVRLAGLWEGPTGQQAQQQASSPAVREAGGHIAAEHADLDQKVRDVAGQLGVLLPSQPSSQQQGWMAEISSKTGSDYDRRFVQLLRQAHGAVLPVIAEVRSGTRNDLVRSFAITSEEFVSRHIGYLENTGLVDYAALPEPRSPGLLAGATSPLDLLVPGLVMVASLLAAVGVVVALRRRGRPADKPARNRRRQPPTIAMPAGRAPRLDHGPRHAFRRRSTDVVAASARRSPNGG